jgi:cell division protease FtsH
VIAIAEALILRNDLTDIDVDEILARVEAVHPFVNPNKAEDQPPALGFVPRALPAPASSRRNGNGKGRSNGKSPDKQPEPTVVPTSSQPPAEPTNPSAELREELTEEDEREE